MTHDNPETPQAHESAADEFTGTPDYSEVMHNEFAAGVTEIPDDEVSRRRFLTTMSASLALAGAAGCNLRPAPQRKIVPYTTQPDELTPGVPLFFASAAPLSGYGAGVLVRSSEGRPTKIEGNVDHPSSLGGTSVFSQASVLDLYDPDRSKGTTFRGLPSAYEPAVEAIRAKLYEVNGQPKKSARLHIVTETVTSPTLTALLTKLMTDFPEAKWVIHDPAVSGNVRAGTVIAFGKPLNVVYDFKKADVVVSLDADFLCSGPGSVAYSRDFASRRKLRTEHFLEHTPIKEKGEYTTADAMNRLYAVECMPTNTGAMAEHRLAMTSVQIEVFARLLAAELGVAGAPAAGAVPAELSQTWMAWIKPLADDLRQAQKPDPEDHEKDPQKRRKVPRHRLIVVGEHMPASLHALAHAINDKLGAIGQTVLLSASFEAHPADEKRLIDLKTLTVDLTAKAVDVLLILGGANPVYSAPVDAPLEEAIKAAGNSVLTAQIGSHQDETAVRCLWHVNDAHYLEAWGDIRGHDGTVAIQQPLIAPLYSGKSIIEFLADVTGSPIRNGMDLVKATWKAWFTDQKRSDPFEIFWQESVRKGSITGTKSPAEKVALRDGWGRDLPSLSAPGTGAIELNYRADTTLYDGRFANNGWMQELPKPLTRLTWDNAVFMSPKTAEKLHVPATSFRWTGGEHGRAQVGIVDLKVRDKTIKAPVWILPGHADDAITVHLGFGRTRAGRVAYTPDELNAEGQPYRGFNAYLIRFADAQWMTPGATVTTTNKTYFLACVQGRWSMMQRDPVSGQEMDRKPVRKGTLDDYDKDPKFAKIPPTAAGETHLIDAGVPRGGHHHHDDEHDHEEHKHDNRLVPLTMYNPAETLTPNLPEAQRRRWAMAVDLSACTGCSACVVACQSENNTPVVGKREVTRGRLMHWINIDRYYGGLQDHPNPDLGFTTKNGLAEFKTGTTFQPRMCVQCENAPCEVVCPVGATVHSADGLNDMTYNRCVGTRYCSNNCPYKVRRFNFLTFADWFTETYKLGRNPDVSVRSRGVMEKCTFCVQRIRGAEIVAEREGRAIEDGEILTACQSACPSSAIMFGDLNVEKSVVGRWKQEPTDYGLLAELNTRPRLTHMAVIRNPNPAMPKGA